jgi:Kef-type K+ transport system membrane component KefB
VAFSAAIAAALGQVEVTLAALVAGLVLARWDDASADALRRHFDARGIVLAAAAFALVGVGWDIAVLARLWPWVLLLAAVRAAGLYWGGRWATRGSLVTEVLAQQGWLSLISQAGVGLLLAAVGRRAFPEWGVSFEALAVALVAVHATVGPICLRWALARRPGPLEGASSAA